MKNWFWYILFTYFKWIFPFALVAVALSVTLVQEPDNMLLPILLGATLSIYPSLKAKLIVDDSRHCDECDKIMHLSKLKKVELEEPRSEWGKTVKEIKCCSNCYFKLQSNAYKFIMD